MSTFTFEESRRGRVLFNWENEWFEFILWQAIINHNASNIFYKIHILYANTNHNCLLSSHPSIYMGNRKKCIDNKNSVSEISKALIILGYHFHKNSQIKYSGWLHISHQLHLLQLAQLLIKQNRQLLLFQVRFRLKFLKSLQNLLT